MDGDHSLNASRPNWSGFVGQEPRNQSSTFSEPCGETSRLDSSRTTSDESAIPVAFRDNPAKDDERVANHIISHHESRPVDFLKLVSLWATANRGDESIGVFRLEGASMAAFKTLGRGLSFNVRLIPVGEPAKQRFKLRSSFVAYKTLRGLTDTADIVERGELLHAALLEVRVLSHPPLRLHGNIAKLLGLQWESDPDLLDQAWPVLVLEHAQNGTLADFQIDYPNLPFSLKKQLCRDVGSGLYALHCSGIVHGDLKSENVLVYDADDGCGVVAKLADFGCAVTDLEPSATSKLPAFTLPWNAPECYDHLPPEFLKYTDVYSYGLLVWRVVLDGLNPFRQISSLASLGKSDFQRQVEILKMEDGVLQIAKSTLRHPSCSTEESGLIACLLDSTLHLDASKRNLDRALELLHEPGWVLSSPAEPLGQPDLENVDIGVLATDVPLMSLQLSIIRELETLSMKPGAIGGSACLRLFELYMERLEWSGAEESAAKWYIKAITANPFARIAPYAAGVFEFLRRSVPPDVDLVSILKSFVWKGCYHSLMELQRRFPSDFPDALLEYRRRGGLLRRDEKYKIIGMTSFDDFGGYFDSLIAKDDDSCSKLADLSVSKNEDLLLHAASRFGCIRAIDYLLSLGIDVDATNRDGETALLQACRAGNMEAAELLLAKGADPAIAASTGETPLHWVFAFDDGDIERAINLLLANGGGACLYATVAPGRSSAVEYLALCGTPLHYAIQARSETSAQLLLSAGADAFLDYPYECANDASSYTPFRLAVRELLPSTIRTIISSSTSMPRLKDYFMSREESILNYAVESSSKAMRRIALGASYTRVLIEMIDLLRTIEPKEKPLKSGMSLVHACIIHGVPSEVIKHLLQTGSKEHLELLSTTHGHTPLQVSMILDRRQTFLVLINSGADIHRPLLYPERCSYLQLCAFLGPRAFFYAGELTTRGAAFDKMKLIVPNDTKSISQFQAPLLAIMMGNFELATFLFRPGRSKRILAQSDPTDILETILRMFPRLPVSRLHYLLEPPEGLEPVALEGYSLPYYRNCFHALLVHPSLGDPERALNFRYLLEQSRLRGRHGLINKPDSVGHPPLTFAVLLGHVDLIREMLAAGANPNLGVNTSVNWAYCAMSRLQKAPSQFYAFANGPPLSRREARWLQDDYKSIIVLLKQHGGREERMSNGDIRLPWGLIGGYLNTYKLHCMDSLKAGQEHFKKRVAQQGTRKTIEEAWESLKTPSTSTTPIRQGLSWGPLTHWKKSIQSSHTRYQNDLTRRNRFCPPDGETSQLSGASGCGQPNGTTLTGRRESRLGFVRWYISPPAQEIQEITPGQPLPSPYPHQDTNQQPAHHAPMLLTTVSGTSPCLQTNPYGGQSYPSGSSPVTHSASQPYPAQAPAAIQHRAPIKHHPPHSQVNRQSQQLPSVQTPELHLQILSQQLPPILLSPTLPLGERLTRIQQCLDTHFTQAGARAVSSRGFTPGSPLGSLFVLKLENGLNHLLHGYFEVMVMKQDGALKALVCKLGERASGMPERARAFLSEGWMGWRELEDKEAEILTHSFE